jgi:hypothetical protein
MSGYVVLGLCVTWIGGGWGGFKIQVSLLGLEAQG